MRVQIWQPDAHVRALEGNISDNVTVVFYFLNCSHEQQIQKLQFSRADELGRINN